MHLDRRPTPPPPATLVTPATLAETLRRASPRLTPGPTPLRSVAIHAAVLAFWGAAFAMALHPAGLAAWSVGVAYIVYDTLLLAFVGWQLHGALTPPIRFPTTPRPTLGVIVAAHDEAAALPATLAALFAQTDPPDVIVIADDGSRDGTAQWLAERFRLAPPPPGTLGEPGPLHPAVRWLRLPHGGKARALNAALAGIDTDVLVTVDADTLLDRRALAAVRRAFWTEPALVASTGVLAPTCAPTAAGRVLQWFQTYEYIRNFLSRRAWMRVDSLLLVSGAFGGYRRDALLAVGGFDPDCLVEDYELIHRLRRHAVRAGLPWTFRVLGDAVARTEAPGTLMSFLRQRRRWFGGFLQTQFWYREMVGARTHGWLGLLMLPVKAVDTLQPLFGLTAIALLLVEIAHGRWSVLVPAGALILAKIAIDIGFHLWSVQVYRRWIGDRTRARLLPALLASLAEPFTFQLLRHAGAAWGWFSVLTGRSSWGRASRAAVAAESGALHAGEAAVAPGPMRPEPSPGILP